MKKVFFDFLGCRLNEAELQSWASEATARGLQLATSPADANVMVLNTCAVTGEAARKSRQRLRRMHSDNPEAKLVVTGCYASLEPEAIARELGVDRVVANDRKSQLVEEICDLLSWDTMPVMAIEPDVQSVFARHKDRAFIKIQDGCRYRCTYCVVTLARGEERSRPIREIVNEVKALVRQGLREIVLTGVHVGGFGSDTGETLQGLVEALLEETDIPRIRFASVEPWDIDDSFWSLFSNTRVMPHMHLPMQSGSDSVLRRMSRRCRTGDFLLLLEKARAANPAFQVTTDMIVGFPGETDEEFQETLDFVRKARFGGIHVFAFSPREGTKAARLPDPVSNVIKRARSRELHRIASELRQAFYEKQQGVTVEVLLESDADVLPDGRKLYWGHTPNYCRVGIIDNRSDLEGALVKVHLGGLHSSGRYLQGACEDVVMPAARKPLAIVMA